MSTSATPVGGSRNCTVFACVDNPPSGDPPQPWAAFVDPVQFGVVMILCSMIGLLTPPVGMCLYTMSSISGVAIGELSWELLTYILGILLVTLVFAFSPGVALWIPRMFS